MIGYIGMYAEGLATYLSSSPDEMWVTGPVGRNHRPGVRVRAGTRLGSGDAAVKVLASARRRPSRTATRRTNRMTYGGG